MEVEPVHENDDTFVLEESCIKELQEEIHSDAPQTESKEKSSVDPTQPSHKKTRLEDDMGCVTSRPWSKFLQKCTDVSKYDKLKQCVTTNPKSRHHIECYETHLANIQVMTLKVYKQLHDIQDWKNKFQRTALREATNNQVKSDSNIACQWRNTRLLQTY